MGKKWAKPDRDKRLPVGKAPLIQEIMSYGHSCQEYGKYNALAIKEKQHRGPKQKELWALMFAAKEAMEAKLVSISTGWPTQEPHGNYVAPPKEDEDEDMAEEQREAVHTGHVGQGPNEVGAVEPPAD